MIKDSKPLSLVEIKEILQEKEDKSEDEKQEEDKGLKKIKSTLVYIKKFSKIKIEKAKDLKKELQDLNMLQLKEKHITKIIDLLPEDAEDLRKIFVSDDASLDQDEITKILSIIKKYK